MNEAILNRSVPTRPSGQALLGRIITSALVSMAPVRSLSALVAVGTPALSAERADVFGQAGLLTFDIPAQSLASALEAYGAATGIEVFYDAALAAGHWSPGVRGSLLPTRALEVLLRGTGYAQRTTGPNSISIVPAFKETVQQGIASQQGFDRYNPYFSILQARLSGSLCRDDRTEVGNGEIIFKFWLAASGVITRAEIIASGGDPGRDKAITERIEGLDVGEPPPAGLPEPVIVAVFPPVEGETPRCPASANRNGH